MLIIYHFQWQRYTKILSIFPHKVALSYPNIVICSNSPVVPWLTGAAAFSPSPPVPSATGPSSLMALEVRVIVTWILWSPTWEMTKIDALEGSGVTLYTFSVSPALLKLYTQKKRQNTKKNSNLASTALFPSYNSTNGRMGVLCMCVCGGGDREVIINIKCQKKGVAQFLVSRYQAYYTILYILSQYHAHNHYIHTWGECLGRWSCTTIKAC